MTEPVNSMVQNHCLIYWLIITKLLFNGIYKHSVVLIKENILKLILSYHKAAILSEYTFFSLTHKNIIVSNSLYGILYSIHYIAYF